MWLSWCDNLLSSRRMKMASKSSPLDTLKDSTNPSVLQPYDSSSSALCARQLSLFHLLSLHRSFSSQHPTSILDKSTAEPCGIQGGRENAQATALRYLTLPPSTEIPSAATLSSATTSLLVNSPSLPSFPPAMQFCVVSEGAKTTQANRSIQSPPNSPSGLHLTDTESASTDLPIHLDCSHDFAFYGGKENRAKHTIQRSTSNLQFNEATLHEEAEGLASGTEVV